MLDEEEEEEDDALVEAAALPAVSDVVPGCVVSARRPSAATAAMPPMLNDAVRRRLRASARSRSAAVGRLVVFMLQMVMVPGWVSLSPS